MTRRSAVRALEQRLGHSFSDPDLLATALTHASRNNRRKPDNRRLEFLGDRVLGLAISKALLASFPDDTVGSIAPRYNILVSGRTCASVAREIDLGKALLIGHPEQASGGRSKEAILADAMEAVIAAIYLDAGPEVAENLVLELWSEHINQCGKDMRDPKSALQEFVLARGKSLPVYDVTARSGPDHEPQITVSVSLCSGETEMATSGSRRGAEQIAARALLDRLSAVP